MAWSHGRPRSVAAFTSAFMIQQKLVARVLQPAHAGCAAGREVIATRAEICRPDCPS
jgi:hypothetical protein